MAKVIMTCGKICAGKSTYAQKLRRERGGVILSVDEITLALFGQDVGDAHDGYVERLEEYLFRKSLEIISTGVDVILDWGFWTRRERDYAREFYGGRGVEYEFRYIVVSNEEWRERIAKRNKEIAAGQSSGYVVDEGLAAKCDSIFEPPESGEEHLSAVYGV